MRKDLGKEAMLFTSSIAKVLLLYVMSPASRSRLILTGQCAGEAHPLLPPDRNLGDKQLDRLQPVEVALLLECFHVLLFSPVHTKCGDCLYLYGRSANDVANQTSGLKRQQSDDLETFALRI
jgi:hypothetical protein